jgi:hypothetical protein
MKKPCTHLFMLLLSLGVIMTPLAAKGAKIVEAKNFLTFTLPEKWKVAEKFQEHQKISLAEHDSLKAVLDGDVVLYVKLVEDNAATFNMQKCYIRELYYTELSGTLECTSPKAYTEHTHEGYTTSITLSKGTATYKKDRPDDVTFVAAIIKIRLTEPLQNMNNSRLKDVLRKYAYTSVVFLYFGTPEAMKQYPSKDYLSPILDSIIFTPFKRLYEDTYNQDSKVAPVKREGSVERPRRTIRSILSLFGEMHVTPSIIERLFGDGTAFVHKRDGQESFNIYCHIVEGNWCYFVEHEKIESYDGCYDPEIDNESHQINRKFARQIINELGPKFIEHSKNNGVKVRCSRSVKTQKIGGCDVDRGGGWKPLPVR